MINFRTITQLIFDYQFKAKPPTRTSNIIFSNTTRRAQWNQLVIRFMSSYFIDTVSYIMQLGSFREVKWTPLKISSGTLYSWKRYKWFLNENYQLYSVDIVADYSSWLSEFSLGGIWTWAFTMRKRGEIGAACFDDVCIEKRI